MKKTLKLLGKAAALFLALIFILSLPIIPAVRREGEGIYSKTLRFHILAASDAPEDQEVKLKVRDGLLAFLSPRLEDCGDARACALTIDSLKDELKEEAEAILSREGKSDPVRVQTGVEYYPTRCYDKCALPAGEYRSLRVFIGEGKGANWWCVVFPPLCLDAAKAAGGESDDGNDGACSGYTEREMQTVRREGAGEVRFFLIDLFAKLKNWLF